MPLDVEGATGKRSALEAIGNVLDDSQKSLRSDLLGGSRQCVNATASATVASSGNQSPPHGDNPEASAPPMSPADMLKMMQTMMESMQAMTRLAEQSQQAAVVQSNAAAQQIRQHAEQVAALQQQQHEIIAKVLPSSPGTAQSAAIASPAPQALPNLKKRVHPDLKHEFDKLANAHEKTIWTHVESVNRLCKFEDEIKKFADGGYPPNVAKFTSEIDFMELDKPLDHSETGDYAYTVTIPHGSSMREAMAKIHHAHAKLQEECEIKAQKLHVQSTAAAADVKELAKAFAELESSEALNTLQSKYGLDTADLWKTTPEELKEYATSVYQEKVKLVEKKLRKEQKDKERVQKSEHNNRNGTNKVSPEELVRKFVTDIFSKEFEKVKDAPDLDNHDIDQAMHADRDPYRDALAAKEQRAQMAADRRADDASAWNFARAVQSGGRNKPPWKRIRLPKNGSSPTAAWGENSTTNKEKGANGRPAKGKGKGKRKNPMGSGKGKGKGKANGGKGKGKGSRGGKCGKGKH